MKVCFISASWVREREILSELNKKVDLTFICPYQKNGNYSIDDVSSFCNENKIEYIINDFSKKRARSFAKLKSDYKLTKSIKKSKPDIIYIEAFGSPYFAIFSRFFLGNKNTIISIMDYKLHERSVGNLKLSEKFYRFIQLNFYKYFQFFSYSQENLFKKEHLNKKSFTIRLFLVATDLMKSTDNLQKNNRVNFLFFGRIFYYKGVDVLIKATNILAQKYDNFFVTIAGNCKTWDDEYKPLIHNSDVFDLKIGYIKKNELPDIFSKANFFVVPYRDVTQSGPLLRAYNYDLIPICSDEEGFLEYVEDEKSGFIFKNESPKSLAESMEKALNLDDVSKQTIFNNINEFKKSEFNIKKVSQKYIRMFKAVLND